MASNSTQRTDRAVVEARGGSNVSYPPLTGMIARSSRVGLPERRFAPASSRPPPYWSGAQHPIRPAERAPHGRRRAPARCSHTPAKPIPVGLWLAPQTARSPAASSRRIIDSDPQAYTTMALTAGTRLGHCDVTALIGESGVDQGGCMIKPSTAGQSSSCAPATRETCHGRQRWSEGQE